MKSLLSIYFPYYFSFIKNKCQASRFFPGIVTNYNQNNWRIRKESKSKNAIAKGKIKFNTYCGLIAREGKKLIKYRKIHRIISRSLICRSGMSGLHINLASHNFSVSFLYFIVSCFQKFYVKEQFDKAYLENLLKFMICIIYFC